MVNQHYNVINTCGIGCAEEGFLLPVREKFDDNLQKSTENIFRIENKIRMEKIVVIITLMMIIIIFFFL